MTDSSLLESSLKALGLVGAAVGWLYQARATVIRGKIKTDLENLEKARALFGVDDERAKRIEAKASQLMSYLYRDASPKPRYGIHWSDFVLGVVCLGGALTFGWAGIREPVRMWWQLGIAGVLGFIALGGFLNAFDSRRPPR